MDDHLTGLSFAEFFMFLLSQISRWSGTSSAKSPWQDLLRVAEEQATSEVAVARQLEEDAAFSC